MNNVILLNTINLKDNSLDFILTGHSQ